MNIWEFIEKHPILTVILVAIICECLSDFAKALTKK